ncbi:hypothetical protein [Streptomyces echinatus]|uniref:hypothetical protein n=1 Tax=Streptomyces echinatus TaxID=67293 RepID=UPI0031E79F05
MIALGKRVEAAGATDLTTGIALWHEASLSSTIATSDAARRLCLGHQKIMRCPCRW